jgi:hypothetical protein
MKSYVKVDQKLEQVIEKPYLTQNDIQAFCKMYDAKFKEVISNGVDSIYRFETRKPL